MNLRWLLKRNIYVVKEGFVLFRLVKSIVWIYFKNSAKKGFFE